MATGAKTKWQSFLTSIIYSTPTPKFFYHSGVQRCVGARGQLLRNSTLPQTHTHTQIQLFFLMKTDLKFLPCVLGLLRHYKRIWTPVPGILSLSLPDDKLELVFLWHIIVNVTQFTLFYVTQHGSFKLSRFRGVPFSTLITLLSLLSPSPHCACAMYAIMKETDLQCASLKKYIC